MTQAAMLVVALVLLGHSTGWAQTVIPSATPASGAAGVHSSTLTGLGFPAGDITGATVHFAATCAAPAIASAPVTQVTTVGALRRFRFLVPGSLAPGNYKAWVSGTAGATAFNTIDQESCSRIRVTESVQGTASLGAAIAGAAVTLVDATGTSRTATTASDGTFALSSGGLLPPFLVQVVTSTAVGSFPAGTTLYSVSADASVSTHINVHVLTDLLVRSFYSAQGLDPDSAFANPVGGNEAPSPEAVQSIANLIIPSVELWLDGAGVDATGGAPSNGEINLISSPFIAYPPGVTPPNGLDAVLHQITSEIVDPADGSISAITIAGGTITETINPVYGNDLITLNTATLNSATGAGSTGSFSALALTSAQQPVLDGITATLTAFVSTINTKGTALTANDLLPFYANGFLHSGETASDEATETADELAGVTLTNLQVSLESVTGSVASVIIRVTLSFNGEVESGVDRLILKDEGGTWLLYGNQRIADVGVSVQARKAQGAATLGPGVSSGVFAFAGASARQGVITSAVVNGPTNVLPDPKIWNGLSSRALFQGAQRIRNGQSYDTFFLLSQALGNDLFLVSVKVPLDATFRFDLTTTTSGNPQYVVPVENRAYTTEAIEFTGIPGSGPLSSLVGNTVNFDFTLPQTFPIGGVFLFAFIYDGSPGNPAAHSCSIGDNGLTLGAFTGSGSITFPANMSACGLPSSVPIVFIDVFLQVEGTNGEDTIVQYRFPY